MTVATEVEQDGLALAFALAAQGLLDGAFDRMVGFGRRHDALCARKGHASLKALTLGVGGGLHQAQLLAVTHQRCHAVVAEPAGVETRRREGAAEGVHLGQRGHVAGVAEVVGVLAARERRAGRRLDCHDARLAPAAQRLADEGKGDAREVGAATSAAHHYVGPGVGHMHLLHGFQADDGLMHQHVVEHRAECVLGVLALHRQLHGLRNCNAEAARVVGPLRQYAAAVLGLVRRRR